MGCSQSNVKKSKPNKATDAATDADTAGTPRGRRHSSQLSRHPADSNNSLAVFNSDSDEDAEELDTPNGTYSEISRRRNSASSMPDARRSGEFEDHFAPVEMPSDVASSVVVSSSAEPQPVFHTSLEDHEKTDSAQAEKEYRQVLEQKRAAQCLEAAQREMDEFDPIRPIDSFNITHRGLLGRCWDRRAAELIPIAFLHAMQTDTAGLYSNEIDRDGNVNTKNLVRSELRVVDSASDASPHSPDAGYPGVFPSRDWSALLHRQQQGSTSGYETSEAGAGHTPTGMASSPYTHPGVPRRSHWFSVCGVASHMAPWRGSLGARGGSGGGGGAAGPAAGTNGGATPRSLRGGQRLRPSSSNSVFTTGSRLEDELYPGMIPPPEVLRALPFEERVESYSSYLLLHERFTGAKKVFAFQLSGEVDDEPDTRFLRSRQLSPSKGVRVVRWNRVEFFNPSLRTLTLAAMDATLGRYESRDQNAQFANAAALGCGEIAAELHAMGSAMFLDGNVSFGQHLLADIKNRSFASDGAGGQVRNPSLARGSNNANASMAARQTTVSGHSGSFFHTGEPGGGATLSEGRIHTDDSGKKGPEFPEESVLCLAMALPVSRLFWGTQFRQAVNSGAAMGDGVAGTLRPKSVSFELLRNFSLSGPPAGTKEGGKGQQSGGGGAASPKKDVPTRSGRLVATPVSSGPRGGFPLSSRSTGSGGGGGGGGIRTGTTPMSGSPTTSNASGRGPTVTTHLVAFNVSSFSASIDPFQWESQHYTRFPVDVDVTKSSTRRQFGEGVITDVLYGGTLVIECNSSEAATELEKMLDTIVWSESRSVRAITQGVHKRMKHRIAERVAGMRRRRKDAEEKEKDKQKEKAKSKDQKVKPKDDAADEAAVMSGYAFRIMRRIGGRPIRDAVELKHIAYWFGEQGVEETAMQRPEESSATAATTALNTGVGGGAEITPSFSRVASAWSGLETMAAVVETWGLHLLANPQFAQPTSLYLQKFSGLVPVLMHTSLMPTSMGLSTNTTEVDEEEAEEDRFFAPELEPISVAAAGASKGSSPTGPVVAKRIPKYNRFYASLPNTPLEASLLDPHAEPGNGGRGGRNWSSPISPVGPAVAGGNPRAPPEPISPGSVLAQPGRRSRNDSVSFVNCNDSFRSGQPHHRDALALSSTQLRPRRGLPTTMSCETMPGTTNFSLPPSEVDEDDLDDHSTVHSDHGLPPPSRALQRVDTAPGGLTISPSTASTLPPSSAPKRAQKEDLRNGLSSADFWSSGMYPTEDSFLSVSTRAPTQIFTANGLEGNRGSGSYTRTSTTQSDGATAAAATAPMSTPGCAVRPSRVIVKRRPSDEGADQKQPALSRSTTSPPSAMNSSTPPPHAISPALSVNVTEEEEQWGMAMLEIRALQAELEDMQHAVRVAQEEQMMREEEQRTLFRAFLPFTSMNRLDALFLYMKTAIHEPDDLPHGCLYLDTPDWLSVLYAVWTSPRSHVRHVNVVYELMCKDLPKLGLLAGLLYFEHSTVGLDTLTLNASKLLGTGLPADASRTQDGDSQGLGSHTALSSYDSLSLGRQESMTTSDGHGKKGKSQVGWFRRRMARKRDAPSVSGSALHSGLDSDSNDEIAEEREAQQYQHYFLTHPAEGGPQMLHYGFGIVTPLYYVTAEQARDTLWWLLCAIAENARGLDYGIGGGSGGADNGTSTAVATPFTLRLAGLPKDKAHYLPGKNRSFSHFFHLRGGSKDVKASNAPTGPGTREWVDEDAMQLGSFIILSHSPSGFVFEDGASPGSPLMSGTTSSFMLDTELSADPRKRHKKGRETSTPLRQSTSANFHGFGAGSPKLDASSGAVALHEHNYGKRAWMHAEAKVEIRPFCHVLYHSCIPVANAIEDERARRKEGEPIDAISGPRPAHYHLPFNRLHNHPHYYMSPERRRDVLHAALLAQKKSASGSGAREDAEENAAVDPELEALLLATPTHPFVFGLQSEEEEKSVLLEEEGRLFRHTEDIWEVLRRSTNRYNKAVVLRVGNGEASELDENGLMKRPILLER